MTSATQGRGSRSRSRTERCDLDRAPLLALIVLAWRRLSICFWPSIASAYNVTGTAGPQAEDCAATVSPAFPRRRKQFIFTQRFWRYPNRQSLPSLPSRSRFCHPRKIPPRKALAGMTKATAWKSRQVSSRIVAPWHSRPLVRRRRPSHGGGSGGSFWSVNKSPG